MLKFLDRVPRYEELILITVARSDHALALLEVGIDSDGRFLTQIINLFGPCNQAVSSQLFARVEAAGAELRIPDCKRVAVDLEPDSQDAKALSEPAHDGTFDENDDGPDDHPLPDEASSRNGRLSFASLDDFWECEMPF